MGLKSGFIVGMLQYLAPPPRNQGASVLFRFSGGLLPARAGASTKKNSDTVFGVRV